MTNENKEFIERLRVHISSSATTTEKIRHELAFYKTWSSYAKKLRELALITDSMSTPILELDEIRDAAELAERKAASSADDLIKLYRQESQESETNKRNPEPRQLLSETRFLLLVATREGLNIYSDDKDALKAHLRFFVNSAQWNEEQQEQLSAIQIFFDGYETRAFYNLLELLMTLGIENFEVLDISSVQSLSGTNHQTFFYMQSLGGTTS